MIIGKFTRLRAIEYDDLDKLLEWRNKVELRRNFREYKELNSSNQKNWFETNVLNSDKTIMFAILDEECNLIGACGICYIDWVNRNADLSIYIGYNDEYIDDKYAPDAVKLLLNYGFDELNLNRIYVEVYDIDHKKKDLIEKLGFKLEGKHRQTHWTEGKWCDSLFYSVLKDEFQLTN